MVQLGPGQKNYIDGWVNVDANFVTAKIDIWADIYCRTDNFTCKGEVTQAASRSKCEMDRLVFGSPYWPCGRAPHGQIAIDRL